ncbi:glycoside hydrolase family 16 protein [Microbispora sp. NPDC046973]|uniref:glycoside hydrolase family 16 protein n=1 Tax=Microbispora sp. NPDC046973 TaxID=3155022 RepID=UPI0033E718A5
MAAAMLIAAATACSSGDSTKVFNAGGESTAEGSASSPGSSGALPGNANAAGLSATQTATAAAAPAGRKGDEAAEKTGDATVAEKIGDIPANPSPRPSPSRSPLPSPGLSSAPRATPAPTAGTETEPPMRLARPVRTADRPVVVDAIEPEDVPRADRTPARAIPGGANAAGRESSSPSRAPSRTPMPRSSGASAGGWGDPALADDFGGQALRLTAGGSAGLSGTSAQRYGRWEVRLRAEEGALPVALLQSARSDTAQYGDSRRGDSRYGDSRYGGSGYDDSWRDDAEYAGPQDDIRESARFAGTDGAETDDAGTEDAAIGVAGIAGGRRAELSVRRDRELARAETAADLTQWHTVAVDWLPGRVTFWLDGRQVWNYTGPYVPRSPLGLVLRNDASGGTVYVDRVRVYRAPER